MRRSKAASMAVSYLAAAFVVCCQLCVAQSSPPSEVVYLWRFQYLRGEEARLTSRITVEYKANKRTLVSQIEQAGMAKTQSVNPRGDATIQETVSSFQVTFNGQKSEQDVRSFVPLVRTQSKLGLVVQDPPRRAADSIGPLWIMAMEIPAPDSAVKMGESWRADVPNRLVEGEKTSLVSTLIRKERVLGVDTLRVHVHMALHTSTAGDGPRDIPRPVEVAIDGDYNVDPLAGRVIHSEFKVSHIPLNSSDGETIMNLSVNRDYERVVLDSTGKAGA